MGKSPSIRESPVGKGIEPPLVRVTAGAKLDEHSIHAERSPSMANEGYHESENVLSAETKDMHRAIVSLMEELEAVDWYNQRVDAASDDALRAILTHNRDEEKEHAVMVLEWIRRRDPVLDKELRETLFTEGPIGHHED